MNPNKTFSILDHNGVNVDDYPCENFVLAPYPTSKEPIFNHDNLTTANRPYYLDDELFKKALFAAETCWGEPGAVRDISWRLHILLSFLEMSAKAFPQICFVELGTGKGYMAHGIASYFDSSPIIGYLYDTFQPFLPGEFQQNPSHQSCFSYAQGSPEFASELQKDLNNLSSLHRWHVIQGLLPSSVHTNPPKSGISLLHVDLNEELAELESLYALDDWITKDTIIIFDDTGAPGSESQHIVHRNYATQKNKKLLYLPTGQSILF